MDLWELTNKKILINSHSYLNSTAGDTIMLSNYANKLMKNKNSICILTFNYPKNFLLNLELGPQLVRIIANNVRLKREIIFLIFICLSYLIVKIYYDV